MCAAHAVAQAAFWWARWYFCSFSSCANIYSNTLVHVQNSPPTSVNTERRGRLDYRFFCISNYTITFNIIFLHFLHFLMNLNCFYVNFWNMRFKLNSLMIHLPYCWVAICTVLDMNTIVYGWVCAIIYLQFLFLVTKHNEELSKSNEFCSTKDIKELYK